MFEADPIEQIAPQSPRAPVGARNVIPVCDMQVYDARPGKRRVGRVVDVQAGGDVVVVHWQDGSRSSASWGGEVGPTTYRGV